MNTLRAFSPKFSVLLLGVAAVITASFLLEPTSAPAQGGVPLWTGPAFALAVDNSGDVFVTGASYNGSNSDYQTIKYSSAGVPLWTMRGACAVVAPRPRRIARSYADVGVAALRLALHRPTGTHGGSEFQLSGSQSMWIVTMNLVSRRPTNIGMILYAG